MHHFQSLKLLIIEDNVGDCFLIQEYVMGFTDSPVFEKAETFEAAKEILENQSGFDAILLDLSLPDLSGETLLASVLALTEHVPVIVLTGNARDEFGIKSLSLGAADYLSKNELTQHLLEKSLAYGIERKRNEKKILISNERYEIVAKATSDTIWDWHLIKKTVSCSHGIVSVFGYSEADTEQTEDWWKEKIHPEDYRKMWHKVLSNFKKGNNLVQDEYRFRCAEGNYKYVLAKAFMIPDGLGRPVRIIGAMQDITQQKNEELRLRMLETAITQSTDAVVITEISKITLEAPKIIFINDAFTKMTGYTSMEILGKQPKFMIGPNTEIHEVEKVKTSMRAWQKCNVEFINYKKDGKQFWANLSIAPLADAKGRYTHWIAIMRDVSERRNHIHAIEEQNKKLKEIAWSQSHLVRAPLARIMGLVNLLKEHEAEDIGMEVDEVIGHIDTSACELDMIIRDIVLKTESIKSDL